MKAADYLQITEIGIDGQCYQIPLEEIREHPVTVGRSTSAEYHYQIGVGADVRDWISSCHCTIFAKPSDESPRGWDYFVKDGCLHGETWRSSSNGIWLGDKQIVSELELRPGLGGAITIFPKLSNAEISSKYHCLLEWPATKESGDGDTHPTLQDLHKAEMKARVFAKEALKAKEQLQHIAKTMGEMQLEFNKERNQQSEALFRLSSEIEEERKMNAQQQKELLARRKAERQIRVTVIGLGIVMAAIGAIALQVETEDIREIFEWTVIILSSSAAIFGLAKS